MADCPCGFVEADEMRAPPGMVGGRPNVHAMVSTMDQTKARLDPLVQVMARRQKQFFGRRPTAEEATALANESNTENSGGLTPNDPGAALLTAVQDLRSSEPFNGDVFSFATWVDRSYVLIGRRKEQVAAIDALLKQYHTIRWDPISRTIKFDLLAQMFLLADDHYRNKPKSDRRRGILLLGEQIYKTVLQRRAKWPNSGSPQYHPLLNAMNCNLGQQRIVLTGHGGWSPPDGQIVLPRHVRMLFYSYHTEPLGNVWGMRVDNLNRRRFAAGLGYMPPVEVCDGGTMIPNYRLYYPKGLKLNPPGLLMKQLQAPASAKNGVPLSRILLQAEFNVVRNGELVPIDVHWAACRSISKKWYPTVGP